MSTPDWKAALSASERYEVIQNIRAALDGQSMSEAISLEQKAFQEASTREDYDAACKSPNTQAAPHPASLLIPSTSQATSGGTRIGAYQNCHLIGEGITSEVYRSSDKALKVIVTNHPLEPHSPRREAKILSALRPPCVPLLETFRDQEQRFVLVFPFMPLTLGDLLDRGAPSLDQIRVIFADVLKALRAIHAEGIIHRDIKPSAVLLASPSGPAYLSDFGTAWHPEFSVYAEPKDGKVLDIGTGPYRAPEVLFANKSYGPPVDMWGFGTMLAEAIRSPPKPLLESRSAHEDGNQLGLILSMFKTLGTPTPETWPEAKEFKVSPFELWTVFPRQRWEEILPDVDPGFRELVAALVRYDGNRATAEEALRFTCLEIRHQDEK